MKVLVFGSRNYDHGPYISKRLSQVHSNIGITELIEGEARGADKLAAAWAVRNNVLLTRCPADWDGNGKSAGMIRNHHMVCDLKPDLAIGFLNGASPGSMNTVQLCLTQGIPLYIIDMKDRLLKKPVNKLAVLSFLAQ